MASLKPSSKFQVWNLLTKDLNAVGVGGISDFQHLSVGGRRISLAEVVATATAKCEIRLDLEAGEKTSDSRAKRDDSVFVPNWPRDIQSTEPICCKEICRAALFVRLVSLLHPTSGLSDDTKEFISILLNSDIIPAFSSDSNAGSVLVQVLTGSDCPCYNGQVLMSSVQAFEEKDIEAVVLTRSEAATLMRGKFLTTGAACLVVGAAAQLQKAIDCIASLSCDTIGLDSESFDPVVFETSRQHRGQIIAATNLKLLLEGSKASLKIKAPSGLNLDAFKNIPQFHGPIQESLAFAIKALEKELNSHEAWSLDDACALVFEPAQSVMAMRAAVSALSMMMEASRARVAALCSANHWTTAAPAATADSKCCELDCSFKHVIRAQGSLSEELATSVKIITQLNEDNCNNAATPQRAASGAVGGSGKPVKDDSGLTEEQRRKAEQKRLAKAEKAASKAAVKDAKKSGISSGIALGTGSAQLYSAVTASNKCAADQCNVNPFDLTQTGVVSICNELIERLNAGGKRKPKIAKGARDYGPVQMRMREQVFATIKRIFKRHGGVEIDTPVFELKEVLTGKYGEDSKLIYDLADQGGELLSLRYDLTVPFARFLAMNPGVGNIKRYHIAKVYRRDQPQLNRGRYREFYQCDFDVAGAYSLMVPDAEVITTCAEILNELPIGTFMIKLNHRRLLDAIFDICGVPADKFRPICSAVDKLDKESWEDVRKEMVEEKGLDAAAADRIGSFVLYRGQPQVLWQQLTSEAVFGEHIAALAAMKELQVLFNYLDAMGSLQHVSFDLSLARGLDYYTGVIYEAVLTSGSVQVGSIAAGGRYDNLVGMFSSSQVQTPCVGVSIGVERVFAIMEMRAEELKLAQTSNIQVFVASIGAQMMPERMKLARQLWQSNISCEYAHQDNPVFKKQLDEVLSRAIPFMLVIGEAELAKGVVKLKNTAARTEVKVSRGSLVAALLADGCVVVPAGADISYLTTMKEKL